MNNIIKNLNKEDCDIISQHFEKRCDMLNPGTVSVTKLKFYGGESGNHIEIESPGLSIIIGDSNCVEDDLDYVKNRKFVININGEIQGTPKDWSERSEFIGKKIEDIESLLKTFIRKNKIKKIMEMGMDIESKQNIRKAVYETNGSSSHSIHIDESVELFDTIIPNEDGIIHLNGGEFGWEVESYNDAKTKAEYLTMCMYDEDNPLIDMLIDTIKEHTGAKEVKISFGGYVDQGNEHGILSKSTTDKETLKNYLFNKKSWLFTTNENCDTNWKIDEDNNATTYEETW